ncbi:MAG: hypothetical protein V4805_15765 [Pseudomonadota bacterium]
MNFHCMQCNAKIAAAYDWRGMTVTCPACSQQLVLEYGIGQAISDSGYAISFTDFCNLLAVDGWWQAAHPVVARMLHCAIEKLHNKFVLKQDDGALIPLEIAHLSIQSDPVKQREMYGVAMNLWR